MCCSFIGFTGREHFGNISGAPTYSNNLISTSTNVWPGRVRRNRKLAANALPAEDSQIALLLSLHTAILILDLLKI
jgi:hypothetical protein